MPRKTKQDIIDELRTELSEQKERSEAEFVRLEKQIHELKQKHEKEIEKASKEAEKRMARQFIHLLEDGSTEKKEWCHMTGTEKVVNFVTNETILFAKDISIKVLSDLSDLDQGNVRGVF